MDVDELNTSSWRLFLQTRGKVRMVRALPLFRTKVTFYFSLKCTVCSRAYIVVSLHLCSTVHARASFSGLRSMPTFQSNPVNPSPWAHIVRKHPALFGVPFLIIIVGASFGMTAFTQTRYDLQNQRASQASSLVFLKYTRPTGCQLD